MHRIPWLLLLLACAVLVLPGSPAGAASKCSVSPVTGKLKKALRQAHKRALMGAQLSFTGPTKVKVGRCGAKRYAIGTFDTEGVGTTDQPQRFTRRTGRRWKDVGDTGDPLCEAPIPQVLVRKWGFDCPA